VSAETAELSDEARSTLFGAARELVRNAVRHSKASATTVALDTDESAVTLTVTDDGVGFDPRTGPQRPGSFGLFAVRDQVERLGGTLDIDSAPGAGTRAQVRVPRQQN
jgi:signal transduction histidine kinase